MHTDILLLPVFSTFISFSLFSNILSSTVIKPKAFSINACFDLWKRLISIKLSLKTFTDKGIAFSFWKFCWISGVSLFAVFRAGGFVYRDLNFKVILHNLSYAFNIIKLLTAPILLQSSPFNKYLKILQRFFNDCCLSPYQTIIK